MIDLKLLRENPEALQAAVAKKKFAVDWDELFALDDKRRAAIARAETRRAEQKAASRDVGQFQDKQSPEFQEKLKAMKLMADEVKQLEADAAEIEAQWKARFLSIPNVPHESVPLGKSEDDNVVVAEHGSPESIPTEAVPHWDIPWFSQAIDFERGVKATGAGFPFYVGDMARFVRSLIAFFLDEAYRAGYTEVLAPLLDNAASATATGQLPDKEGQMYHATTDDL